VTLSARAIKIRSAVDSQINPGRIEFLSEAIGITLKTEITRRLRPVIPSAICFHSDRADLCEPRNYACLGMLDVVERNKNKLGWQISTKARYFLCSEDEMTSGSSAAGFLLKRGWKVSASLMVMATTA
jgi:hypothetical protein